MLEESEIKHFAGSLSAHQTRAEK
jgi:hypothetical protein